MSRRLQTFRAALRRNLPYPPTDGATSESNTVATVETDTVSSIVIPRLGQWDIFADGLLHVAFEQAITTTATVDGFLQENIDSAGWVKRQEAQPAFIRVLGDDNVGSRASIFLPWFRVAASVTNGSTYEYRLSATLSAQATLNAATVGSGSARQHRVRVWAVRVGP